MTGPVLATVRYGRPARVPVPISTRPPAALYLIALSTRLATRRSASPGSPAVWAGSMRGIRLSCAPSASSRRAAPPPPPPPPRAATPHPPTAAPPPAAVEQHARERTSI